MSRLRILTLALALSASCTAAARGVTAYLPLGLSPELERAVERLLILADRPVLTRPIAVDTVRDALEVACERDRALCEDVRRHLARLLRSRSITHASASIAGATPDSEAEASGADGNVVLPNRRGMRVGSAYEVAARAQWRVTDYLLLSGGVAAYEDEAVASGTLASLGFEYAQLDLGYRDHWLSPLTDSAMLLSSNAQTMPSVTLSNPTPLTRLGLRYQLFYAQMSESETIRYEGGTTSGHPRLAGMHVSIAPWSGWTLGFNRLMQYGGGARDNDSLSDLFDAWFRPSIYDNTGGVGDFGNQLASITSSFVVPTGLPFAVHFEYAGEDTSRSTDWRLGNAALSAGIRFPRVGADLDLTFEASEWQNAWYVHHIYLDGLTNEGNVIGHWGGDWRVPGDGVGGRSLLARVGWQLPRGGSLEGTYRTLENEDYSPADYERAHVVEVRYSRAWQDASYLGGELSLGRDMFGESFARVAAFIRF